MFPLHTRVLIVDDMPTIREMVKQHVKTMGYKNLVEAENGQEAFEMMVKAKEELNPFGLIISDWNMPKMKGIDFLRKVRAVGEWKELAFVLLTSESEREQVTEAVFAGVSQYIVKPFSPKTLEEKLRSAYEKHPGK